MSNLYDDLIVPPGEQTTWDAVVASDAPDFATRIFVTIPDLDPDLQIGPCKWMPRDSISLPSRGDDCLVQFNNDREPWVIGWWPFDE